MAQPGRLAWIVQQAIVPTGRASARVRFAVRPLDKGNLMCAPENRRAIVAVVLLVMVPCGFAAMDYLVPNNGQARRIIGLSLFALPLLSLALGIKSRRTKIGSLSLFLSIPMSPYVIAATFWWFTVMKPQLHPRHLYPCRSSQRLDGQPSNTALHPTP